MKLLIITQSLDLNNPILGFFHRWIEEFSKHCEKVTVICLEKGEYHLSKNVKILSMGKEVICCSSESRDSVGVNNFIFSILNFKLIKNIIYIFNFYKYILQERKNYDSVFIHMNPIYVILGGFFWKAQNKKIGLWYTHKSVDFKLKIAEKFCDKIFSASAKSFRLFSNKIVIFGHGIDLDFFSPVKKKSHSEFKQIITAGRIAPIKNYDIMLDAIKILKDNLYNFRIRVAGIPILDSDRLYLEELKEKIKSNNLENLVEFIGVIPYKKMPEFYHSGDIFINLSDTGSLDKAVLEAMACGLNVLTSNEAFASILPEINKTKKDTIEVAKKIAILLTYPKDPGLRDYVLTNHSLNILIKKILTSYQ